MNWDDLRFFLLVARARSLSGAAKQLGVSQPTVGRRVAALERRLGAKLFIRRSDGFDVSCAGAQALEHAERMEQDALALERQVSGRDEGVRGTVRVTASEWLVTSVLAPSLAPILERHPRLVVELVADQRHLNLGRREADLALRPRRFEHDAILQRATAKAAFGLYATDAYLARCGTPTGDGSGHVVVAMTDDVGDIAREWLDATLPAATRSVRTNGRDAMVPLAIAGVGLACLARIVGDAVPALRLVPTATLAPTVTLWLGVYRDTSRTPRVKAVAAYVTEQLRRLRSMLCPEPLQVSGLQRRS
jgi:DNA-binding transcriptional LysR family regulator